MLSMGGIVGGGQGLAKIWEMGLYGLKGIDQGVSRITRDDCGSWGVIKIP